MKRQINAAIDHIATRVPLRASQRALSRDVVGLNYHVVSDEPLPHIQHILQYKSRSLFASDLDYLAHGHELVSYRELAAGPGDSKRREAFILTFDDGYRECYTIAAPALRRVGVPCTFFVITSAVDNRELPYPNKTSLCIDAVLGMDADTARNRSVAIGQQIGIPFATSDELVRWVRDELVRWLLGVANAGVIDRVGTALGLDWAEYLAREQPFMTSAQIRGLVDQGFTVGAHSVSHAQLSTLSESDVEREIVESCRFVQDLTGQSPVPFAFPFSGDGVERSLLAAIRRRYDVVGLLFDTRGLDHDEAFIVNRIPADGGREPYRAPNLPGVLREVHGREVVRTLRSAVRPARRTHTTT